MMKILLLEICFGLLWSGSFSADCGCAREQFTASATVTYTLGPSGEYGTYQNLVRYSVDNKNMRIREDIRSMSGRKISTTVVDMKNDIGWLKMPGIFDCSVVKPTGKMDERCSYGNGKKLYEADMSKYEVELPKFPGKLIASFDKLTCYPINFNLVTAYGYTGSTKLMIDVKFDFIVPYTSEGSFYPLCDGKPTMEIPVPSMSDKVAKDIVQVIPFFSRRK